MYGDRVRVDYYDIATVSDGSVPQDILQAATDSERFYPMVFVDGALKIAGSAEYYDVIYALRGAEN